MIPGTSLPRSGSDRDAGIITLWKEWRSCGGLRLRPPTLRGPHLIQGLATASGGLNQPTCGTRTK
eukprot:3940089-Rhodomonas_salina.1